MGYPFYTFECLDHNSEVVSRIDVMIREWNTKTQLLLGASGNPDVTGFESAPFATRALNDYCDWKDFGADEAVCDDFDYSHLSGGLIYILDTFASD